MSRGQVEPGGEGVASRSVRRRQELQLDRLARALVRRESLEGPEIALAAGLDRAGPVPV